MTSSHAMHWEGNMRPIVPDSTQRKLSKRKLWWKIALGLLVVVVVIAFLLYGASRPEPYYAMGGEAMVVDKFVDQTGYHIVIDQRYHWSQTQLEEGSFTEKDGLYSLTCARTDYFSVQIGDIIEVDRKQEAKNQTGTVEAIRQINGVRQE